MNVHKNARLTPRGREVLVSRLLTGERIGVVAAEMGVSVRTAVKWRQRWFSEGPAGLLDRSSRPRRMPRRLALTKQLEILRLRRERRSGPQIAAALAVPLSTVGLELRRRGLGRLGPVELPPPVVRYERARPGELLHLDTKKLGRVGAGHVGHRIHGDRSVRSRGAGWEFVHVCVDDCTRLAYVEVLPNERGENCAGFLERALGWFQREGIRVEGVMTDNGPGYRSRRFAQTMLQAAARHVRTRPYTPRTNGKAERFIRTSLQEWAYAEAYTGSDHRTEALARFLDRYNSRRPHMGLSGKTPRQRLAEVNNVLGNYS